MRLGSISWVFLSAILQELEMVIVQGYEAGRGFGFMPQGSYSYLVNEKHAKPVLEWANGRGRSSPLPRQAIIEVVMAILSGMRRRAYRSSCMRASQLARTAIVQVVRRRTRMHMPAATAYIRLASRCGDTESAWPTNR